jgi:elongation factor G
VNHCDCGSSSIGKKSLLEALLFEAGVTKKLGMIENGDTTGDHDPISREFGHSIESTLAFLEARDIHLHIIDTPGSMDFIGKPMNALMERYLNDPDN